MGQRLLLHFCGSDSRVLSSEMADVAYINGAVLKWARERRGMTPDQLATKAITAGQIKAWEADETKPTHPQAEKIAERLRIPLLMLFLSAPPDIELHIPDLRTVSGSPPNHPSLEFVEVINDVLLRQDWYRQNQVDNGAAPLGFVGRYNVSTPVEVVAADIRRSLGVTKELRQQCASWKEFLRYLIEEAEQSGILVFRSAIVRHATKRRLSAQEFRGFVVSDHYAPVVFVNDDDARRSSGFHVNPRNRSYLDKPNGYS
jgi:transcriptional regulator with XRE-family HTH domain